MQCITCGSEHVIKKGPKDRDTSLWRWKCTECGQHFHAVLDLKPDEPVSFDADIDEEVDEYMESDGPELYSDEPQNKIPSYVRDETYINNLKSYKRIVITSAQNDCEVDEDFIAALRTYCSSNSAGLMIIPIRYKTPGKESNMEYDDLIEPYLVDNDVTFDGYDLKVLGSLKLLATAVNPLAAMDAFSKGKSLIIGHSQLQLRTMARGKDRKYPAILTTTGSVTKENYSITKSGAQADFNHSMSAVVIEFDSDGKTFFMRHLNYGGDGYFYDLNYRYSSTGLRIPTGRVSAIVTGDTHVRHHDPEVEQATFGYGSLCDLLHPKEIVRHDVLDFETRSHHSIKDQFIEYTKHHTGRHNVEDELIEACEFLTHTSPKDCLNVIVASNHDSHLDKWLRETDGKKDPENAKIFHLLSYLMYERMENESMRIPQAFEVYWDHTKNEHPERDLTKIKFLSTFDSYKIHGIELACHGHNGISGARGSPQQFANVPHKMISGHSHSPSINKGCYVVGTSSEFHLPYINSFSKWDHAHCIIYPNGKRQLIFLRNGKFRAE